MNGSALRKIEIFAPFGAAYELTQRILFQPFDFGKWLTIAFAAFLAGLADGTHFGFSSGYNHGSNGKWQVRSVSNDMSVVRDQLLHWITVGVVGFLVVAVIVVVLLFLWLGSRGRFIFIDCIVRNGGAIAEPWREFRREGNAIFLLSLGVTAAWLCLAAIFFLPVLIPHFRGDALFSAVQVVYLALAGSLFAVVMLAWAVTLWFAVPVMYRQRCSATTAIARVIGLIGSAPGAFVLYVLFALVLLVAGTLVSCVLTCVTCCLAALPYIGTVILLPLYVFYYAYTLCFLRQFGTEYDAWAAPPPLPAGPATT